MCTPLYWMIQFELLVCMQVLAKSCKMVPVMIMGTLIGGKIYSVLDYGCATLIAAGISLFANQSSSKVTKKLEAPNAPLGYTLCLLNLFFDGYTNAKQVSLHENAFIFHCQVKAVAGGTSLSWVHCLQVGGNLVLKGSHACVDWVNSKPDSKWGTGHVKSLKTISKSVHI